MFAMWETEFFHRIVDAQLSFELGPDGQASALVLHQNKKYQRGLRI
jgi:serine-type D-Ala-D-Ala carboxypeptidase/endopeptidase